MLAYNKFAYIITTDDSKSEDRLHKKGQFFLYIYEITNKKTAYNKGQVYLNLIWSSKRSICYFFSFVFLLMHTPMRSLIWTTSFKCSFVFSFFSIWRVTELDLLLNKKKQNKNVTILWTRPNQIKECSKS